MTDQVNGVEDEKFTVGRGPSYPFIDLERAIERVQQIADKGAERSKMPPETFYKLWNYAPKSSGGRQTMAALNGYGLVEYVGKGNERRVTLSDLARRIVLDRRPDSAERARAIATAALESPIFGELYNEYGPILPDRTVMESWLTIDRGFNQQGAEACISNFIATLAFSGLDKPASSPTKEDSPNDVARGEKINPQIGDLVEVEVNGQLQFAQPMRVRAISADGEWLFIDGSETGISATNVTVVERSVAPVQAQPPRMPIEASPELKMPEKGKRWPSEMILGPLDIAFESKTVVVQGRSGSPEELGEFIEALQELKAVLERSNTKKNRFLSSIHESEDEENNGQA